MKLYLIVVVILCGVRENKEIKMQHNALTGGDIHNPFAFVVADTAARNALVVVAGDLYKLCFQIDTNTAYILIGVGPATWQMIGSNERKIQTLKRNADKSITHNISTFMDWTTEKDSISGAWIVGQPTRITIPSGYTKAKFKGSITWAGTSTVGSRGAEVWKNGILPLAAGDYTVASGVGNVINIAESEWLDVVAGDYFEVKAYQSCGAALVAICTGATFPGSWFEAEFR